MKVSLKALCMVGGFKNIIFSPKLSATLMISPDRALDLQSVHHHGSSYCNLQNQMVPKANRQMLKGVFTNRLGKFLDNT